MFISPSNPSLRIQLSSNGKSSCVLDEIVGINWGDYAYYDESRYVNEYLILIDRFDDKRLNIFKLNKN